MGFDHKKYVLIDKTDQKLQTESTVPSQIAGYLDEIGKVQAIVFRDLPSFTLFNFLACFRLHFASIFAI